MQVPPTSPPLSVPGRSAPRGGGERVDVKALLGGSVQAQGRTGAAALEEARMTKIFSFRVKKPQKKTESLEKEVLYKKRVIQVDLNECMVRYGSSDSSGRVFPGPDRILRVSISLDHEAVVDFFFTNLSWKNKSHLRLFFRSQRERDVFFDLYTALPGGSGGGGGGGPGEEVSMNRASGELPKLSSEAPAASLPAGSPSVQRKTRRRSFKRDNFLAHLGADKFSVFVATWNMGNEAAPTDLGAWIKPGYDVYAIAAQETTLSQKQQEAELKLQKQHEAVTRGEVLLKEISGSEQAVALAAAVSAATGGLAAATADAIGAREAKQLRKKAKEAIRAASELEMQEKNEDVNRARREYERLHKEALALAKEAKRDKSRAEIAAARKADAENARAAYKSLKYASSTRKKELQVCPSIVRCSTLSSLFFLQNFARHVKVDQAASVIELGEKPTKKDTHFVSRIRAHMATAAMGESSEVAYVILGGMRLIVFVRRALVAQVSCVDTDQVTCGGPGGKYSNKGCCAVSLFLGNTSLCFVGAHLAAHMDKVALRNQNFHMIMSKLSLGMREWPALCKYDHLFFFGDLNYRVELAEETVVSHLRAGSLGPLLDYDQLTTARKEELAFGGFDEDAPTFFPTFKMVKNSGSSGGGGGSSSSTPTIEDQQQQQPSQQPPQQQQQQQPKEFGTATVAAPDGTMLSYYLERVPAFCDRVLVRSGKHARHRIRRLLYEAVYSFSSSDHLPVHAAFQCGADWRRPVCDLATLERNEPLAPCFMLLSGLGVRLRGGGGEGVGEDLVFSCFGPTFLSAGTYECAVASRPWDAPSARAPLLGALALTCRSANVEFIRAQKVYVRVASAAVRGFGILRAEVAFGMVRGAVGVPFEVELYSKHGSSSMGVLCGVVSGYP